MTARTNTSTKRIRSDKGKQKISLRTRLEKWSMPEPNTGCHIWFGARQREPYAYGVTNICGQLLRMHRVAYELEFGPIPDGLVLDHLCKFPPCVNPYHLEPVTQAVNIYRGMSIIAENLRKTHCRNGHLLDGNNLYRGRLRSGNLSRICRTCRRAAKKEWDVQNKSHIKAYGHERREEERQQKTSPWMALFPGKPRPKYSTKFRCTHAQKINHNADTGVYTAA